MRHFQEMNENQSAGLKGAALASILLWPTNYVKAQEENEDDEAIFLSRRDLMLMEEEEDMDSLPTFRLTRRMRGLIVDLIILLIFVFLVNRFSSKRNRKGCIIFTIFIFVMFYIINKFI